MGIFFDLGCGISVFVWTLTTTEVGGNTNSTCSMFPNSARSTCLICGFGEYIEFDLFNPLPFWVFRDGTVQEVKCVPSFFIIYDVVNLWWLGRLLSEMPLTFKTIDYTLHEKRNTLEILLILLLDSPHHCRRRHHQVTRDVKFGLLLVSGVSSLVGATLATWYSSLLIASLWRWNGKKQVSYRHLAQSIFGSCYCLLYQFCLR